MAESKVSYMHQHVVTNVSTFSICIYTCTCAGDSVGIDDHEKGLSYCTLEFFVQHPNKADGPSDFLYETCKRKDTITASVEVLELQNTSLYPLLRQKLTKPCKADSCNIKSYSAGLLVAMSSTLLFNMP